MKFRNDRQTKNELKNPIHLGYKHTDALIVEDKQTRRAVS